MPTRIAGIVEIVLRVHDMHRALAFYHDLLGLERLSPADATSPIFLRAGEPVRGIPQMIVLVQMPDGSPDFAAPRPLHHLALVVAPEAFDSEKARLERHGIVTRTGKHPLLPSRTLYLDDPDGNEVEIICEADA